MDLQTVILIYVIITLSAVIHEYAHAWTADRLGDPTPRMEGRLTLNPLPHIDPFGTFILPLALLFIGGTFIGWARPVPFNPYNLRDPRWGVLKVGFAGPASNFVLALALSAIYRFAPALAQGSVAPLQLAIFLEVVGLMIYINIMLGLFNLIPVPPLDGSKVIPELLPYRYRSIFEQSFAGIAIALFVAFFFLPYVARAVFWVFTGTQFG